MSIDAQPLKPSKKSLKVAVVGARGYSGLELCAHLLNHPLVELSACGHSGSATGAQWKLSDDLADERALHIPTLSTDVLLTQSLDTVFLATPAEASIELAPQFLAAGFNVIDLSGAFRLGADEYKKWYGHEPAKAALLEKAEYGLVPFAQPTPQNGPRLIANPGCYATASLLALIPLLKAGLIDQESVVIDAKSGASGAGRKASESTLFTEVAEDCRPYRVGNHQHEPEILRYARAFSGAATGAKIQDLMFTPHLLPIHSGILVSLYAKLQPGKTAQDVAAALDACYRGYPLVRMGEFGTFKHQSLARVRKSPFAHISYQMTGKKLHLFCSIDNLQKGAASQAIENLNRIHDLPPHTGLTFNQEQS